MNRFIKPAITIAFGIVVYIFWTIPYRATLSYQEQYQLFLLDSEYFREMISRPDGFACYAAEFLVQFYNNYWVGAAIIAALFMLMQALTYQLAYQDSDRTKSITGYILSFVPVLLLWLYMGDPSVMPTFMVAVTLSLVASVMICKVHKLCATVVVMVVGLPLLYWLIGPAVYITSLIFCLNILRSDYSHKYKVTLVTCAVICTIAPVIICAPYVPYPIKLQAAGIDYYRNPTINWMQFIVMTTFLAIPYGISLIRKPKHDARLSIIIYAAVIMACTLAKPYFYNPAVYELIEYDYLVRAGQWQKIIDKAESEHPDLPMSVCATNMALAATDQLCERAFQFYQGGAEGLLPQFQREPHSSLMTGEAYFQLGLTNTAQRFYFEAQEAIPNYNKSARCMKRIAETNIVNGQYEVAKKYLRILQKTIFYRNWATRTLSMIDHGTVDQHPLYGRLRQQHIANDFLFSTDEIDKILGQLYLQSTDNNIAKQYLLMYPLLQRDINRFMQYMQVVQQRTPYMPTVCQEGVAFAYMQQGQQAPTSIVSQPVSKKLKAFADTWTKGGNDTASLDVYRNTLWYYLMKGSD